MMNAARSTASRTDDAALAAPTARHAAPGPMPEAERIDEEFLGRSRGNFADYAIRTGQLSQTAARRLRSVASIQARDPRCLHALGPDGAATGLKLATTTQILGDFRSAMSVLLARGPKAIPTSARPRLETARKLAMSRSAGVTQIALIADALARDLYRHGDPKSAYVFAAVSGQAVNRAVSTRARVSARLDNVALR